jgi:hypothetical protein
VKRLRRWYNDWATTFRDVFGTRVQIRLGLTSLKRSAKEEEEDAAPKKGEATAATAVPPVGGK